MHYHLCFPSSSLNWIELLLFLWYVPGLLWHLRQFVIARHWYNTIK
jgi:hypothetical protein